MPAPGLSNSIVKKTTEVQPHVGDALNYLDSFKITLGAHSFSLLDLMSDVVLGALVYFGARLAYHIVTRILARSTWLDSSQRVLVQKLSGIGIVAIGITFGADLLGINLKALTVFSGAFGLAVGFGLQKTFGNLLAGLILLLDRSVKPGDVIVVGNTFGAVSRIGVRAVSVVTRDGKEFLIPNEKLMTDTMENWSHSNKRVRVHIPVGVSYQSDIMLAQKLMITAARGAERVLDSPAPSVWLKSFGESSVDHEILVWIDDPEQGVGSVRSEILNKLWVMFKEHNIDIPFTQTDIHIRTLPDNVSAQFPAQPTREATRAPPK